MRRGKTDEEGRKKKKARKYIYIVLISASIWLKSPRIYPDIVNIINKKWKKVHSPKGVLSDFEPILLITN